MPARLAPLCLARSPTVHETVYEKHTASSSEKWGSTRLQPVRTCLNFSKTTTYQTASNRRSSFKELTVRGPAGHVLEWEETAYDGTNDNISETRIFRGGGWFTSVAGLPSTYTSGNTAGFEFETLGLRVAGAVPVATVPEPSTVLSLWLLGGVATLMRKRRLVAAA